MGLGSPNVMAAVSLSSIGRLRTFATRTSVLKHLDWGLNGDFGRVLAASVSQRRLRVDMWGVGGVTGDGGRGVSLQTLP